MIGKKAFVVFLSVLISAFASGQQINLRTFSPGVYGSGGGITVPLSLSGCFGVSNEFQLYLSDASGNFSNATKIGTYYGFFTPFINGIIPAGTPAGTNYKIRVVSTSPVVSKEMGPISISAATSSPVPNPTSTASNTIYDSTFGRCLITTDQQLVLQENVPTGKTLSAQVRDSTGAAIAATISGGNQIQFTMTPGNYYSVTIQLKNNSDNNISTKSFLVLACSNNLSLQTSGANDVCLPASKSYTVNVTGNGGIKNNYPGCKYTIDWGDGTISTYTHCELIARNGELLHTYKTTSCGRPPITELSPVQYNAFRVGVSASNPNCPSAFTALTTYAKAWEQPIADFEPVVGCLNSPVTFVNTSKAGTAASNNAVNCTDNAVYEWYVDGKLVFNAPKDLVYTFTTLGTHTVRLVAINEPCSDEITKQIEIREGFDYKFTVNGFDSLNACAPAVVNIKNTTSAPAGTNINDIKWNWRILKRNSITPAVKGEDYVFVSGDSTSINPSVKFLKAGSYRVRLSVDDYSCSGFKEVSVVVKDSANIAVPVATKRYCGLQSIDFRTDVNHKLTYSSNDGSETYKWSISGGSYSFENGTNSSSPYPKIKFNDYATYTLAVVFGNGCGTHTTPFEISFDRPITATAGKDTTLCNSVSSLPVSGVPAGPYKSYGWTIIRGKGTLSDANVLNPVYTFSSGDSGSVTLRYTVYPVNSSVCAPVFDDMVISLNPYNKIISADSVNICSGSSVNYTPTATIDNSTFSWTSTVISGTLTGNSASGTGSIKDVLINTSKASKAVIKYAIVPIKGNCNGEAFSLTVIVAPRPNLTLTVSNDSVCNGTNTDIKLASSYVDALFTWTASASSANVTGFSNQNAPTKAPSISQKLVNPGNKDETVTYTVKAYGGDSLCSGETKTVTIVVKPGLTVAVAGNDQLLCNRADANLIGNNPTVGTSSWQQISGPSTAIVNSGSYNASVSGLQPNRTYTFLYSITGMGTCPPTTDTVLIVNRPKPVANAGTDITVCNFTSVLDSVQLSAKLSNSFETGNWQILLPKPVGSNPVISDSSKEKATFFFDKAGTYKLVWHATNDAGCAASTDTVFVTVSKKPFADSLTAVDSICKGDNVTVTAGNNTGNIKKWQYNPAPFHDNMWIDSLTTSNFINFNNLKDSLKVRIIVESATGCTSNDTSAAVIIHVVPQAVGGTTSQNDSVCGGSNNGVIVLSGNVGNIKYWESSTNNGTNWSKISDTTSSLNYLNISQTTWYRAVVQTGNCASAYSDTTIITVLNTVTQAIVGDDQVICGNKTELEAIAPAKGETGIWIQITGPNTATLSSTTNPVVTASGLVAGSYKFVWELANGGCRPTRDTVTISVRPPVTKADAGNDLIVCDIALDNSINLHGNQAAARPFEKGEWSIVSQPSNGNSTFSNTSDPSANFNFKAIGVYVLQWKLTNDANCSTTLDTVSVRVYQRPVSGFIKANTELCVGSDVTVTMGNSTGVVQKWQYNRAPLNDNIWRDTLVTSSTINFISIPDSFAIRAIVQSFGANDGCLVTDTSNVLIINATPGSVPGTSGPDNTVCTSNNGGVINLNGNVGEILRWEYSDNSGATWNVINNSSSSITYKNLSVTTWFKAIVQSGLCGNVSSSRTIITVLDSVTKANAGADQIICAGQPAILAGNIPSTVEQVTWTQSVGSPATFSATNVPNPTISNLKPGIYEFVYTISNGYCPPKADTVSVTVNNALVNIIDTTSKNICAGQSVAIVARAATGGNGTYNYQWQKSTDGINWTDLSGETDLNLTVTPQTDMYVRRVVTSLPCTDISFPAFITVQAGITNNSVISSNQNICINTPAAVLNGSVPSGAVNTYAYGWESSIDSGRTWLSIPNATSQNYDPGVLLRTTSFRRNVTSGLCIGSQSNFSNVVTIVVNPDSRADFNYTKDISCPPFILDASIIVTNTSAANGTYTWYGNEGFIGSGASFPGYALTRSQDSVLIRLVTNSAFGCKSDTMEHKFYTRVGVAQPVFSASVNEGCGPLSVLFTNQTPNLSSYTYKWNFGNGQTSIQSNPGSITFRANPNYGDTVYVVSLTAYSGCDSITVTQDIKVRSAVQALFKPNNTSGCSPMKVIFTNYSEGSNNFTWNFDDGTIVNTTQTGFIEHTFTATVQDTFRVSLIARSSCGSDTQYYSIVVAPNKIRLLLTINGNEKEGCSPHTVRLVNNSKNATSFRWDFGDGNILTTTKNIDTITHQYTQAGIYTVKLHASNGCSDTATTETVTVYGKPVVSFSALPQIACIGDTVRFTNASDSTTGLTWIFGDGTTSNLTNPKHKYTAPGVYNVSLIGIRQYASGSSCIDSARRTITINDSLQGKFSVSDSLGSCAPFTVTFTNNNRPSAETTWDFGDGTTGTGDVVKHTFLTNGTFNVKMIARDPGGCAYRDNKNIRLNSPNGSFSYDHGIKCDNIPVRFAATTNGVDSVRWNFGDGTVLTTATKTVYHTYLRPGYYVPSVELITPSSACRTHLKGVDTIKVDMVNAGFMPSVNATCGNTNVTFTDTSRAFSRIQKYSWNLGDGSIDSIKNPVHNYRVSNSWPVQLIVTTELGCSDTASRSLSIVLKDVPVASILSDSLVCASKRVSYTSSVISTDAVSTYRWSFTNGANALGSTVNTVYTNAGRYNATLIVNTVNGCADTATRAITVNPTPMVQAVNDRTICLGESMPLNVTGALRYSWSPSATLSCNNCPNPIATPTRSTKYTVVGDNSFGCISMDTVLVTVAQPFDIATNVADTICTGQVTQLSVSGAERYSWTPALGLNNPNIPNPIATPAVTTRYRVIGTDNSSCFADTAYVTVAVGHYPTVALGADKVLAAGSQLPFSPQVTGGPIRRWEWFPRKDLTCYNCPAPVASIKQDISYAVRVTNELGCSATDTINIKVFCENTQVYIPNVFTPDNDGINDILIVRGSGIRTIKTFRIFNRWGEVVFEKAGFSPNDKAFGWDGTVKGAKAPTDVYVYTCEVTCENENSYVYKGNVAIIK